MRIGEAKKPTRLIVRDLGGGGSQFSYIKTEHSFRDGA